MVGVTSGWSGGRSAIWGVVVLGPGSTISAGDPEDVGHAQRPRQTARDGETVRRYPLTAQSLGGAPDVGEGDFGGV
jgi:hypothetical protein